MESLTYGVQKFRPLESIERFDWNAVAEIPVFN